MDISKSFVCVILPLPMKRAKFVAYTYPAIYPRLLTSQSSIGGGSSVVSEASINMASDMLYTLLRQSSSTSSNTEQLPFDDGRTPACTIRLLITLRN